jgi:PAS domain S-box-containing protein
MTKRLSNTLPRNGDLARTAIRHCVDGLLVIDTKGIVQFANPAAISLFADRTRELVGHHVGTPAIKEFVEMILPGRTGARYVEMRSTEIIWEGRAAHLASLRDITDRKRAEEAVRGQAEELLKRNRELIRFNHAAVGREMRMIELKREVNQLCLDLGQPVRHRLPAEQTAALKLDDESTACEAALVDVRGEIQNELLETSENVDGEAFRGAIRRTISVCPNVAASASGASRRPGTARVGAMFDNAMAAVARTYPLETAPVLVLRIDGEGRLLDANRQARRLLGDDAVGRHWAERLVNLGSGLNLSVPVEWGEGTHRLTLSTVSGIPETLYFRFLPLPDGTLALGSLDLPEQQSLSYQLLALMDELNDRRGELHSPNAELRQLNDINCQISVEMNERNEILRQQSLASLSLMEDAVAERRRAEQTNDALRESEAQFRSLVEGGPDAIYVVSQSSFKYVNAAACRLFGADSRAQLVGQSVFDRCHPSMVANAQARLHQLFHERRPVPTVEQTFLKLDGSSVFVDVTSVPIVYEGEESALAFARDITDRRKAQEELRNSERRYRSLLEATPDPMVVVDSGARIMLLNGEAERVFGYERTELLGQSLDLIIPAPHCTAELIPQRELTSTPRSAVSATEGYAVRKDGVEIPVEIRHGQVGAAGPDVIFSIRDLSSLKRAEAKFQRLLDAAPDALVVSNGDGQIVLMNTQAERMFGISRASALGRKMNMLFQGGLGGQNLGERIAVRADGTEFPVEMTLSPLQTEDGMFTVSAIRDVTERKKSELRSRQLEITAAEAEAANKAKSMFLSNMSHEIRTPMNAILGYSQLMLRDASLGDGAKANLRIINRSGEHLLTIIDDILDMARIEAGRMQLAPKTFNLRNLLLDIESMFRLRAETKLVQFEVLIRGEAIEYIVADEGKIRQVLINLLGNAVKFTECGRVSLEVSLNYRADARLWLSAQVEDTGIGMTAEEQNRLFEPFVQGQASQQMLTNGTGLGLSICQGVTKLMGGSIAATSILGNGSTFVFEIPVDPGDTLDFHTQSPRRQSVLGLEAGQGAPRILIADDVMDNREWLSGLLTAVGFSVRSVDNGEAAVRSWKEWSPQLILMDVHMPIMNGLEAARSIKSLPSGHETVIIALTADAMNGQRRLILDNQIDDFLAKPCIEHELLEKIRARLKLVYVYEEETLTSRTDTGLKRKPAVLNPQDLAELPADLIDRLRDATLGGDKAQLNKLLLLIDGRGLGESAGFLRELVNTYKYREIIELLDKVCVR